MKKTDRFNDVYAASELCYIEESLFVSVCLYIGNCCRRQYVENVIERHDENSIFPHAFAGKNKKSAAI